MLAWTCLCFLAALTMQACQHSCEQAMSKVSPNWGHERKMLIFVHENTRLHNDLLAYDNDRQQTKTIEK